MSTQNTSTTAPGAETLLATEEQLGHILDQWKRRLKGRAFNRDEANTIIRRGGRYLPVMDKAADVLLDQVRFDIANTVVRMVRNIRRDRTAQEAIDATGRVKYVDSSIAATMPVGQGPEEVELEYFCLRRSVPDEELAREYESRGRVPDPQAQAADNEHDPAFADSHPNGTHWKLPNGGYGFLAFGRWVDERGVYCYRFGSGWGDDWWFAGVRKSSPPQAEK